MREQRGRRISWRLWKEFRGGKSGEFRFLIFLSLIVYMGIQKQIESVEMSLDILRNLKCNVFEKEIVIRELTKDQKKLYEKIGIIVPNTMGI